MANLYDILKMIVYVMVWIILFICCLYKYYMNQEKE